MSDDPQLTLTKVFWPMVLGLPAAYVLAMIFGWESPQMLTAWVVITVVPLFYVLLTDFIQEASA